MYKTLVINSDEWVQPLKSHGCFPWNYDEFVDITNSKKKSEENLAEMFNAIARKGYRLIDERIRRHDVYDFNEFLDYGHHGIYLFEEDKNAGEEYCFYFGPTISIPRGCKRIGCGSIGCGSIGCKGAGCRLPFRGIGCSTHDTDEQFINFEDDNNNTPMVSKLNKYFGLRQVPHSLKDSYAWAISVDVPEAESELAKDLAKQIEDQFYADVKEMEAKGFHFQRMIDLPSEGDTYTSAMLFSRTGRKHVRLSVVKDENEKRESLNISDFDLWYFPAVYGFFGWLWYQVLGSIPFIGKLFGSKNLRAERTTAILKKEELEAQYDKDINSQVGNERLSDVLDRIAEKTVHFTTVEVYQRAHSSIVTALLRIFRGITYKRLLRDRIPFVAEK